MMLDDGSNRDQSQDVEPRSESKQGQLTEREGNEQSGKMTPRSKALSKSCKNPKGKVDHRASAKRIRTLFQETISTKVKKQEKYIINQLESQSKAGETALKSQRNNPPAQSNAQSPEKALNDGKQAPFHNSFNANQGSNLNVRSVGRHYNRVSSLRKKGSRADNKDEEEGLHSDDPNDTLAEQQRKRQEWLDRFKRKPLDPEKDLNPDGTEKWQVRTRLMIKILNMKAKREEEHSEDHMVNSFDEEVSTVSYDDEDDEVDEEELKARKAKKKAKKKKAKKANMLKILQMNALRAKQDAMKKKKIRRPIMNVYCTDYDVVKKAAKMVCGFRLKEYKEDHDGGIVNGEVGQKLAEDWDVTWHNGGITADFFAKMQPYQKVNQYPGIQCISRKNNLARNLVKIKKAYPEKFKFFPRTWILPMEASEFRNNFIDKYGRTVQKRKTYIVKPDNMAQGRGIYLSRNFDKIIEQTTNYGGGWVVQDYLTNPHLIENLKYDLRLYVFLYGLNPLRIFIHEQGLARFATEPYEKPRNSNIDNMYVHLTNYAINKFNRNFKQSNKKKGKYDDEYGDYGDYGDEYDDEYDEEETGHKRSLFAIMKIIYQQGGDPDKIWEEIKDIVVKTIVVGQPYMDHMYRVCQPECIDNSMCFQILGFDVMIDKNFRPWLIEVNQSPSFATDSPLDYEVKKNVLKDAFQMLNLSQERRENFIRIRNEQNQERMMTGKTFKMSPQERERIRHDKIQERIDYERVKLNGSGYEQIFPQIYDEVKNAEYEQILKKAQEIWDDFTTGKQKRHRVLEEQEKKKQEQIQMANMLVKSIKKKTSKVSMPETSTDNKIEKKSNRLSSSDDEAIKQPNTSIDNKEGEQSDRSSRVNASKTEKKPTPGHQRNHLLSPNRTSYNADCRSSKGENPFNIKQVPSLEKKNSGLTQQAQGNTVKRLSENRNSISNQMNRKMDDLIKNPSTQPIQKSLKPSMIHMDLNSTSNAIEHIQQTPSQFNQRKKQPVVPHPKQVHLSAHGINRQINQHRTNMDPFSSKDTANEYDNHAKTSIDSRPSSNPQGSPSKRYYMGEASRETPSRENNFNAQKQYLEDIVQRQEQKIKYYQRIIQQQRLIDDKLLQTTAGMSKAADPAKMYSFRNDMALNTLIGSGSHQHANAASSSNHHSGQQHSSYRVVSEGRHSENTSSVSQAKRGQHSGGQLSKTQYVVTEEHAPAQKAMPSRMSTDPLHQPDMRRPSQSLQHQASNQIGQHLTKFEQELLPQMHLESDPANDPPNAYQSRMSRNNSHSNHNQNEVARSNNPKVPSGNHQQQQAIKANQNIFMSRMANLGHQQIAYPNTAHKQAHQSVEPGKAASPSKPFSQSVQNINLQQNPAGIPNQFADRTQTPHHKLIIGAIRGEGTSESKNFFQAAGANRLQGQNATHEVQHMQQEPKGGNLQHQAALAAGKNLPPRNLKNVKFQHHEFAGPYNARDPANSATATNSQYTPDGFQHLVSSMNMVTPGQYALGNQMQSLPTSGQFSMNKHSSPKGQGGGGMQGLTLQGTKKECHDPQRKFEMTEGRPKGMGPTNEGQVLQPAQVEFSRVMDDQMNFEKTKKDQFRDYKNLVVQDQGRDESRFKSQKRSVYTQPGMPPQNTAPSRQQQNIQKLHSNEIQEQNIFMVQSSKINFQDQTARRQGEFGEQYRKSLDLQNIKVNQHQLPGQQQLRASRPDMAGQQMQVPAMKIKKMEPVSQAALAAPGQGQATDPLHPVATPPPSQFSSSAVLPKKLQYPHVKAAPTVPGEQQQNYQRNPEQASASPAMHHSSDQYNYGQQHGHQRILSHQSISPLKTSGYRNQIQYGSLQQRAPHYSGSVGKNNSAVTDASQGLRHDMKPMGQAKEGTAATGRMSGFNVKSPILTNQGYQIAGMSSNAPGGGLHSSASPMKEFDLQNSAGLTLSGVTSGNSQQKQQQHMPEQHHFKIKFIDKQHSQHSHPSQLQQQQHSHHQHSQSYGGQGSSFQQTTSPLTINPNYTPQKNTQSIRTIKESPEPISASSIKEHDKDLIKNAGHAALFGSLYVSGSKNHILSTVEKQRNSIGTTNQSNSMHKNANTGSTQFNLQQSEIKRNEQNDGIQ